MELHYKRVDREVGGKRWESVPSYTNGRFAFMGWKDSSQQSTRVTLELCNDERDRDSDEK